MRFCMALIMAALVGGPAFATNLKAVDFGVKAEGLTDDGPAILDMIETARAKSGETVRLVFRRNKVVYAATGKDRYRQLEEQVANYYGWVAHWTPQHDLPEPQAQAVPTGDTHLRSMNNVCKYTVMAFDGRVGSIADFILDDNGWRLPSVAVDTSHYLSAGQVAVPAIRFKGIRVEDREISVDLNKADVEKAPRLDPTRPLETRHSPAPRSPAPRSPAPTIDLPQPNAAKPTRRSPDGYSVLVAGLRGQA